MEGLARSGPHAIRDPVALRCWCRRVCLLFVAVGPNPAGRDNEAIRFSEYGYADVVRLLLADERVDPTALDEQTIVRTCANGHQFLLKLVFGSKTPADLAAAELNEANAQCRVKWRKRAIKHVRASQKRRAFFSSIAMLVLAIAIDCIICYHTWDRAPSDVFVTFALIPVVVIPVLWAHTVPAIVPMCKLARDTSVGTALATLYEFLSRDEE